MKKYQIIIIDIFDPGVHSIEFSEGNDVVEAMENAYGSDWRDVFPEHEFNGDVFSSLDETIITLVVELGREIK